MASPSNTFLPGGMVKWVPYPQANSVEGRGLGTQVQVPAMKGNPMNVYVPPFKTPAPAARAPQRHRRSSSTAGLLLAVLVGVPELGFFFVDGVAVRVGLIHRAVRILDTDALLRRSVLSP